MLRLYIIFALVSSLFCANVLAEDTQPNWDKQMLTGNWGGARSQLYDAGIEVGITHKSDVLSNVSGGLKRGTAWLGHTEIRADFNLEKLLGWESTNAFMLYHSDLGSKFNAHYIGSIAGVDNIEVTTNTAQFYYAYLQKSFFAEKLSVLFGLYSVDGVFYVTDSSSLFIQSPLGISTELAASGLDGAPAFPVGALMLHAKAYSPSKDFYVQAAITDGVPGDPDDPRGTHIKLGNGDGSLSIVELAYNPQTSDDIDTENFNKTAIGYWRYSGRFDNIDGLGGRGKSEGAYILSEQTLWHEAGSKSQGLAGFVRFGVASKEVNALDWTGSLGLRYKGLIAGRDDDVAGIAMTISHAGKDFRQAGNLKRQETELELTYRAEINSWLAIQPTIQGIINPGLEPSIKDAWLVGTRIEIAL
jgi:porin